MSDPLPPLGSLWRLVPDVGGHVVLVIERRSAPVIGILLAVNRPAGPEDVVVETVDWRDEPVPIQAISCRQEAYIQARWLERDLGQLGELECAVAGHLNALPPQRGKLRAEAARLIGPAYEGRDDPRLDAADAEAAIARGLTAQAEAPAPSRVAVWARKTVWSIVRVAPPRPLGIHGPATGDRLKVEIPESAKAVFGEYVNAQVAVGAGRLRVTVGGVSLLEPGETLGVAATRPDGTVVTGKAKAGRRLEIELEWPVEEFPLELTVGVVTDDEEDGTDG